MELCALLVIWTLLQFASAEVPFKSSLFLKENITEYDTFTPIIIYQSNDRTYPDAMWISIVAGNYNFTLKLKINRNLISPRFVSKHYKPNNVEVVHKNHSNCFYQGIAENFPSWVAVMSTCHGLRGSFGDHSGKKQIHIEPLSEHNNTLNQPHAFYVRAKEATPAKCGTSHNHTSISDFPNTKKTGRARRQISNGNYVVELLVVNDWAQLQNHSGDVQATVMRATEIVNGINSHFTNLGIHVVLSQVITWTNGNQITVATDPATLLDNFSGYKPSTALHYNAALLFTGIAMDSQTIGIAYVGTMCTSNLAVGIIHDYSSAITVSSTASHELGHILSMVHDTGSCQCNDTNGCIMIAEMGSQPPNQWSSCSIKSLIVGLNTFNSCLYKQNEQVMRPVTSATNSTSQNTPLSASSVPPLTFEPTATSRPTEVQVDPTPITIAIAGVLKPTTDPETPSSLPNISQNTITTSTTMLTEVQPSTSPTSPPNAAVNNMLPTCGNGIREDNEVCDCGPTKVCKDPCCDPSTCQLFKGVQCSSGACCIGCYFARASVSCRASTGECDVAEYCTGSSPNCPQNLFVRDGALCAKGKAYCYNGSCPTRDSQCKALYGSSGGDGDSTCYKQYNTLGSVLGNCGRSRGVFTSCSESNVLCGSLQCSNTGSVFPAVNNLLGITYMGTTHRCKSFVYTLNSGINNNVWTVNSGTICGNNKVCIAGQCTNIQTTSCPSGKNGLECSGKGVCTNNGSCICNAGYSGTTCS